MHITIHHNLCHNNQITSVIKHLDRPGDLLRAGQTKLPLPQASMRLIGLSAIHHLKRQQIEEHKSEWQQTKPTSRPPGEEGNGRKRSQAPPPTPFKTREINLLI